MLRLSVTSDSSSYDVTIGIAISSGGIYIQYFLNEDKSVTVESYFTVEDKHYLKILII